MHQLVREHLERYLSNAQDTRVPRALHDHLAGCPECREEVGRIADQALLLRSIRPEDSHDPAPGFYARVMDRVESQRTPSIWAVFLQPVFGKRLVFACLFVVALLGSYMVSTEPQGTLSASSPEVLMATDPHPFEVSGANVEQNREKVLVALASYEE